MEAKNILFYDGDCALCNRSVQFIVKHEKENSNLLFCSLQSGFAKTELAKYHYNFSRLDTMVLLEENSIHLKSGAGIALGKYLRTPYSWIIACKIFPRFIR